jgi:hypothetical protein
MSEQKVSSPDGRTWSVKTSRHRRRFKESRQAPYLVAHVIVTTVMVIVFFLIIRSPVFQIISIFIAIVLIVWLVGFLNSMLRVTISADTPGPPPDHRVWLVTKRRGVNRRVRELVEAIGRGQDSREPEGTRLVEI